MANSIKWTSAKGNTCELRVTISMMHNATVSGFVNGTPVVGSLTPHNKDGLVARIGTMGIDAGRMTELKQLMTDVQAAHDALPESQERIRAEAITQLRREIGWLHCARADYDRARAMACGGNGKMPAPRDFDAEITQAQANLDAAIAATTKG